MTTDPAAPRAAGGLTPLTPARAVGAVLGRDSLVRRLVLLAAAWSLAVLLVAGLALGAFFSQAETASFNGALSGSVDELTAGVSVDKGQVIGPADADPRTQRAYSGSYWEIATAEPAGPSQMVRSRSLWDRTLPLPPGGLAVLAATPGQLTYYDTVGPLKAPLRVAAMQGRLPDMAQPVIYMVAMNRSPIDRAIRTFDTTIAAALALLGVGLIVAVIVQVRVGLAPLFALRREVTAIRTGRGDRIAGHYPTELEPLATELNALMAHTQEVVERQRTHVGNLAHALKTPLSVILTEAGQQPGPLSDVVSRQARTMGQQIDHHLRRARAAARAQGPGERTALAPVLEDLSRTLEKIFHGRVSAVDWDSDEDLFFHGERQDLMEIAGNVMENACKWSAGRVRVAADVESPRQLRLTVEDDGPGLEVEQHGAVLRRGERLDEQTPGSGLGLSIVDELVRAYGGSLTLDRSSMGGLKVVIRLPRAEG